MKMTTKTEKRYEVIIDLMKDRMSPNIQCLSFSDENSGYRLTESKGCGNWEVIKKFKCSFTLRDLRQYAIKK